MAPVGAEREPDPGGADLVQIYAGAFYGMMGLILVLVYTVASGIRLVVSEVDHGDLAFTLTTPVSRREVILTKALFHVGSIFLMVLALSVAGTAANAALSPGELDYEAFWKINLVMLCYFLAIGGLVFAASCWFNKTGNALGPGAGLPIAFFLFGTIAGFGEELEWFKYLTLNTLFNPTDIILGESQGMEIIVLLCLSVVLYTVGMLKFVRKDLPL